MAATLQVFKSQMYLMAIILVSADTEYFHQHRKHYLAGFTWKLL